jgi:hypothetical protein
MVETAIGIYRQLSLRFVGHQSVTARITLFIAIQRSINWRGRVRRTNPTNAFDTEGALTTQ